MPKELPVVLSIGGADSSAGAGIQADLKAIHTNGGYGLTAVTGVVAETPHEVCSWEAVSPAILRDQIEVVCRDYPIAAVKVGLLFNPGLVSVVAETLALLNDIPVVLDPVGTASTGAEFGGAELRTALVEQLFPLVTVVTPNLPEACLLLGRNVEAETLSGLAEEIGVLHEVSVLLKGGHRASGTEAVDSLWTAEAGEELYALPWVDGGDYHGTGCVLSSSIATGLAKGLALPEAVLQSKRYLHNAMLTGLSWPGHTIATKALDL